MKPENAGKIKYGVWGLIWGGIISIIVGFGWGGWTTAATTENMSAEAVLASQAAICVAQFVKQPNHEEKLKEIEKVSSWERDKFIEKGGWDKMPGQEKARYVKSLQIKFLQGHSGVRFYNQLISCLKFKPITHNCISISAEKSAARFLTH